MSAGGGNSSSLEVPINWIDASRADFYQNFIVPSRRLFNRFTSENIGRTVVSIKNSFRVNCSRDLLIKGRGGKRLRLGALDYEPQHERQLSELGGERDVGDHTFVLRQQ
jgi:hypothetical protein